MSRISIGRRAQISIWRLARLAFATALAGAIALPIAAHAIAAQTISDRDRDRDDQNERREDAPIQHVVVIFQENVSFDHYFATYPNVPVPNTDGSQFAAAPGTPLVNGLFPGGLLDHNPNTWDTNPPGGPIVPAQPFRLSALQAVTCDQGHGYLQEQMSFNAGAMNTFPDTVGVGGPPCIDYGHGKALVMGYYDGNTVTALWKYAQHFAMSDNSFSTTFGPSTPGALNLIAGQTHGAVITPDAFGNVGNPSGNVTAIDATGIGTVIGDPRPSLALDGCTLPSNPDPTKARTYITLVGRNVGDLLNAHHVTWGWFQGGFRPAPPPDPPLPNTPGGTGPVVCGSAHAGLPGTGTSYDYIPHHEPFQYYAQTSNPQHLPPSSASKIGHTDQANHQYDLQDFWTALESGHLPSVSYLKAAAYQDGHAAYSDPIDEQMFLVETINRLMRSPEWEETAIIIAYDDSDGWYDHVMGPITHQSNTPDDALFGSQNCGVAPKGSFQGRCGFGPRQPLLVISPWARRNYVDHTLTDQSSILKFIEDNWHLGRLGNQSSDAEAGSLLGMFDFNPAHARRPRLFLNPDTGQ